MVISIINFVVRLVDKAVKYVLSKARLTLIACKNINSGLYKDVLFIFTQFSLSNIFKREYDVHSVIRLLLQGLFTLPDLCHRAEVSFCGVKYMETPKEITTE